MEASARTSQNSLEELLLCQQNWRCKMGFSFSLSRFSSSIRLLRPNLVFPENKKPDGCGKEGQNGRDKTTKTPVLKVRRHELGGTNLGRFFLAFSFSFILMSWWGSEKRNFETFFDSHGPNSLPNSLWSRLFLVGRLVVLRGGDHVGVRRSDGKSAFVGKMYLWDDDRVVH